MFLEAILMKKTMDELRNIFSSVIEEYSKPQLKRSRLMFKPELERLFSAANEEAQKNGSDMMGTEHVLLAILNKSNNFKMWEVFDRFGIKYDFVFEKCNNKNEINTKRNMEIPLKGLVNQTAIIEGSADAIKQFTINTIGTWFITFLIFTILNALLILLVFKIFKETKFIKRVKVLFKRA